MVIPDINIIDSQDDVKLAYIEIANCKVPVVKAKLGDMCYILKIINNVCHIELDTKDCEK